MNKAFTANINDQVTARGYLDENNQLIMLEPEGSGGGDSDFTTAIMTVVGEATGLIRVVEAVNIRDERLYIAVTPTSGTHEIVLYKGSQDVFIPDNYEVTGSASLVPDESNLYTVTGDFTITYSGGGA